MPLFLGSSYAVISSSSLGSSVRAARIGALQCSCEKKPTAHPQPGDPRMCSFNTKRRSETKCAHMRRFKLQQIFAFIAIHSEVIKWLAKRPHAKVRFRSDTCLSAQSGRTAGLGYPSPNNDVDPLWSHGGQDQPAVASPCLTQVLMACASFAPPSADGSIGLA